MELVQTVVYFMNRSLTVALKGMTPFEAWHGQKLDLSHLKPIETTAFIHIPKEKRKKLDEQSIKGYLARYGGTNQYRIWVPDLEDVKVARDVIFVENESDISTIIQEMEYVQSTPEPEDEPESLGPKETEQELLDMIEVLPLPRQETRPESTSARSRKRQGELESS